MFCLFINLGYVQNLNLVLQVQFGQRDHVGGWGRRFWLLKDKLSISLQFELKPGIINPPELPPSRTNCGIPRILHSTRLNLF